MPGPRVKGKRSSAVQLRAAHVRPLQSGSLLAVRPKAADVTAAVRFRGRIWNPPLRSCCRGRRPRRPAGGAHVPGGPYEYRKRELVGRPALWPPRRGQDPSLQCNLKRGAVKRERVACANLRAGHARPLPGGITQYTTKKARSRGCGPYSAYKITGPCGRYVR